MKISFCVFFSLSAYSENTRKVFKYLWRMRRKYLSVFGDYAESIYAYMEKMANWGYLRYTKSSLNTWKVFKRIRRIRGKNLCVSGEDVKGLLTYSPNTPKDKSVFISVNNNTSVKFFYILSIYIKWDRLSQKTISRYCPFNKPIKLSTFYLLLWNYLLILKMLTETLLIIPVSVTGRCSLVATSQ